jgi:hypothetical protein
MQGAINDPLFPEDVWAKLEYVHRGLNGSRITVHAWQNLITGEIIGAKIVATSGPK